MPFFFMLFIGKKFEGENVCSLNFSIVAEWPKVAKKREKIRVMFARNGQKCAGGAKDATQMLDFFVNMHYTNMRRFLPGSYLRLSMDRQPQAQIRALICVLFSTER